MEASQITLIALSKEQLTEPSIQKHFPIRKQRNILSRIIQKSCIVTDIPIQLFIYHLSGKSYLFLSPFEMSRILLSLALMLTFEGGKVVLKLIDFIFNNVVNKIGPLNQSKAIPLWTLSASNGPCCFHYFQFLEKQVIVQSFLYL